MRLLVALLLLSAPLAGLAHAQGAPRSIGDCERVKGDLAYNGCLATFGPRANVRSGGEGAPAAAPPPSARTASAAEDAPPQKTVGRRGRSGRYARHGRSRASFSVGRSSRVSYRRSRRR